MDAARFVKVAGWFRSIVTAVCLAMPCGAAVASASVDASAQLFVFPIVAHTSSFTSEITVYNPNAGSLGLVIAYYGGKGSAAPGYRRCADLFVWLPTRQVQFDVGKQCSLPAGTNFGMLQVSQNAAPIESFHAFSRVTNPRGIGFSVPAFPWTVFESGRSSVIGLKRQAAAPGYQTNCFVGSLTGPTAYQLALYSADGVQIGTTLSGTLAEKELVRFVDVFSAVGAPAGDHSNVRAEFVGSQSVSGPGLIAFCTVQDNTSFGADFRIAGASAPMDYTRTHRSTSGGSFAAGGSKHVYQLGFRIPDWLRCKLQGTTRYLEMRVIGYDSTGAAIVVAGGNSRTDTGRLWFAPRSAYVSAPWRVEVSIRDGLMYPGPTFPLAYTVDCETGSGHTALGSPAVEADDF
jgi:hypothetical protein